MNNSSAHTTTQNKVWISMIVIAILFIMFVVTTYAFVSSFVTSEGNLFETATVDIDLNGGQPVFTDDGFFLEPGREAVKEFTVTNNSTIDVYYRLYLKDIEGELQNVLTISLYDENNQKVFTADMKNMNNENPFVDVSVLKVGETRTLKAGVLMAPESGNEYQNSFMSFAMVADAAQVRNNPNQEFE